MMRTCSLYFVLGFRAASLPGTSHLEKPPNQKRRVPDWTSNRRDGYRPRQPIAVRQFAASDPFPLPPSRDTDSDDDSANEARVALTSAAPSRQQ